jgi:WD40 repeat protein
MDTNFADKEITPMVEIACNPDYRFTSFTWGPLDKSIYTCTTNGRVIQYDTTTGKEMQWAQIHTDNIYSICLTHDSTMISTGSHDNSAKILDPKTLKEIRTFYYGKPVRSAVISPLFDDPDH